MTATNPAPADYVVRVHEAGGAWVIDLTTDDYSAAVERFREVLESVPASTAVQIISGEYR